MKKVAEIAFFTSEVEAMASFYERLLDMEPVARSDDMAIFMLGETKLFIHRTYAPGESGLPPENHFAFAVPDVDAACEALGREGLVIEIEPQDYYWGRSAYLRDPDGHLIELTAADEAHALGRGG